MNTTSPRHDILADARALLKKFEALADKTQHDKDAMGRLAHAVRCVELGLNVAQQAAAGVKSIESQLAAIGKTPAPVSPGSPAIQQPPVPPSTINSQP